MRKTIFLAVLAAFLFWLAPAAYCLQVKQIERAPYYLHYWFDFYEVESLEEVPRLENAVAEVAYLEEQLPWLKDVDLPFYLVGQRCYQRGRIIDGCACHDGTAYIFASTRHSNGIVWVIENSVARTELASPYLTAHAVAHEVGHLIRFRFVPYWKLEEYWALRGCPQVDKEELFAEDFRWLFASDRARVIDYQLSPAVTPPGQRESEFFRRVFSCF